VFYITRSTRKGKTSVKTTYNLFKLSSASLAIFGRQAAFTIIAIIANIAMVKLLQKLQDTDHALAVNIKLSSNGPEFFQQNFIKI